MCIARGIKFVQRKINILTENWAKKQVNRDGSNFEEHTQLFISLVLTVVMSTVVKLFDTQQKLYKTLGFDIYQSQSCHSKCLISIKSLFFLISSLQLFISTTAFFLFEARTVDEYGMSFYISITIFSVSINITTIAWKMDEIFVLLRNYEEFIDKS